MLSVVVLNRVSSPMDILTIQGTTQRRVCSRIHRFRLLLTNLIVQTDEPEIDNE